MVCSIVKYVGVFHADKIRTKPQFAYVCHTSLYAQLFLLGNEEPRFSDLYKDVVLKFATRWKDLGVELQIPMHHLEAIQLNNCHHPEHCQHCCKDMLRRWMEITPKPTWNILQKAIDNLPLISHDENPKSKEV